MCERMGDHIIACAHARECEGRPKDEMRVLPTSAALTQDDSRSRQHTSCAVAHLDRLVRFERGIDVKIPAQQNLRDVNAAAVRGLVVGIAAADANLAVDGVEHHATAQA